MTAKKTPAKPAKKSSPAKPKAAATAKPSGKKPPVRLVASKPAKAQAKAPQKPAPKAANGKSAANAKQARPPAAGKPADKTPLKAKAPPPRRKLNVGQKPRTERVDAPLKPPVFLTTPGAGRPEAGIAPKASPASKEAKQTFRVNDHVVYPAHGVGRIVGIEKQQIAGVTNELFVIDFEQEKMKLRVPTAKAISVGMRGLAEEALVKKAIDVLKGRARVKRTMWSRRAQEYEAKINSGDIIAVAEVVRDLYRATDQPEQSYSERQLFEAAQDRLAREVAAVRKTDLTAALAALEASLQQKKAA